MSHIERRKLKTGVSWRVRYVDPDGVERSRSFKKKADAEDFETSTSHNLRAGSYVDPSHGQQTVKAYLEEWRAQQSQHRASMKASTKTRFEKMVYPHIGALPIAKLRPSTIRAWQTTLLDGGYSASTVNGVRGQVAGAFNDAVMDRRLASSPFTGVKAPEIVRAKIVPRSIEQVRAGETAMTERYQAIVPVVAGSGLRSAEVRGLTRDRVDFLRKTIRVDRQLARVTHGKATFGPTKTKASDRTVPIPDMVIDALAKHLADYPAEPGELIFRTARGTPMTAGTLTTVWEPVAAVMGLSKREGIHQLRHFYASLLIADGRSVIEVQERLGHATAQETLDTYAHLFPDSDEGTRSAIDRAFAPKVDEVVEGTSGDVRVWP